MRPQLQYAHVACQIKDISNLEWCKERKEDLLSTTIQD